MEFAQLRKTQICSSELHPAPLKAAAAGAGPFQAASAGVGFVGFGLEENIISAEQRHRALSRCVCRDRNAVYKCTVGTGGISRVQGRFPLKCGFGLFVFKR